MRPSRRVGAQAEPESRSARLPPRRAHSSSGLGHRPLTAAARVRIPYAPLRGSRPTGFRLTTRVRCTSDDGNARLEPPGCLPQNSTAVNTAHQCHNLVFTESGGGPQAAPSLKLRLTGPQALADFA